MPAASSIVALLVSVLALIAGNGLLNTLVPLRAKLDGFGDVAIGLLGSAYFAGMLAGTLAAPALIARVGSIRAFSALAALAVMIALLYPVAIDPMAWVALRYGIGFVFAGFYAVIESWLSHRSSNANRGRIYALYQVVSYVGTAGGQQILAWVDPRSTALFSVAAGFFAVAMLPLAFTQAEPPPLPRTRTLRLGWLFRHVPVAAVAVLCIGAANGSFWALAPVYGLGLGLSPGQVATLVTAVVIGTALALYPVGRRSDRTDRCRLMVGFALAGIAVEAALASVGGLPFPVVALLGVALGATTMVLYTLAVSHANDEAGPDHAVTVAAGLLFLYCVGAIVAPLLASAAMARWGTWALFAQNAVAHAVLVVFAIGWQLRRAADRGASGSLRRTALR